MSDLPKTAWSVSWQELLQNTLDKTLGAAASAWIMMWRMNMSHPRQELVLIGADDLQEFVQSHHLPSLTGVGIAEQLARRAHATQKDKFNGEPYVRHLERVVERVSKVSDNSLDLATAWLHDVLEDTPVTVDFLRQAWVPEAVIDAVKLLTRQKHAETYDEYITHIIEEQNWRARTVKLADLQDHLETSNVIPKPMRERYEQAWERLTGDVYRYGHV